MGYQDDDRSSLWLLVNPVVWLLAIFIFATIIAALAVLRTFILGVLLFPVFPAAMLFDFALPATAQPTAAAVFLAVGVALIVAVAILSRWMSLRALLSEPWRGSVKHVIARYLFLILLVNIGLAGALGLVVGVMLIWIDVQPLPLVLYALPGAFLWLPLTLRMISALTSERAKSERTQEKKPLHFRWKRFTVKRFLFRALVFAVPLVFASIYVTAIQTLGTMGGRITSGTWNTGPWPTNPDGVIAPGFTWGYLLVAIPLAWGLVLLWQRMNIRLMLGHVRREVVRVSVGITFITIGGAIAVTASAPFLHHGFLTGLVWALSAVATLGLYVAWSNRWRGEGNSPSPLAGFLNPPPRSGHVWMGQHIAQGYGESKVRPLIILKREGNDLHVCYMSSGDYAKRTPQEYFKIENQSRVFRGMRHLTMRGKESDDGFVRREAVRIDKSLLRQRMERCPSDLYAFLCWANNIEEDPMAKTIDRPTLDSLSGGGRE